MCSLRVSLAIKVPLLYNVHMKRLTASEARRNWFRLLDEVVAGETIMIERQGTRVIVQRQDPSGQIRDNGVPDYRDVLDVPDLDDADSWGWEWTAAGLPLAVREPPEG